MYVVLHSRSLPGRILPGVFLAEGQGCPEIDDNSHTRAKLRAQEARARTRPYSNRSIFR
jgi:hypothetical protein